MSPHPYDYIAPDPHPDYEPPKILLFFLRVVVPVTIALIGVVLIIMGHGHYKSLLANKDSLDCAVGCGFILVAACIWMLNWMMRMSVDSDGDRDKEAQARAYFVQHGHWPSES